jgi:V/A-type H+-transporting ATPase subunit A
MSADGVFPRPGAPAPRSEARVVAVQDDLVVIALEEGSGGAAKNEVVFIRTKGPDGNEVRLQGEVLRVRGAQADVQVFESTAGVAVGEACELAGRAMSAELGPGLLGQVFDGLQAPLEPIAVAHGVFLPRGARAPALSPQNLWPFHALTHADAVVAPGDPVGWVEEGRIRHTIFAPFDLAGEARVRWIEEATFAADDVLGEIETRDGVRRALRLAQRWPVRRPLALAMGRRNLVARRYPTAPLFTSQRIIDTFFPIAKGGAACIPGPFGAGKTILQNLIARFTDVDVVIVVACGERAGEVVEMMGEFARLRDPRGGGALMDRTIIFCNTSAMPVAAREASIHMGATVAEYYRHMGLDVLLLADSTSRWAQALRETSGRLEEIPGEEAYPAALASEIKAFYERAGVSERRDGARGSLSIIGAVSPAGGNLEEPVTQATLAAVKCFLGLSAERAYARAYPAIDPLMSWTRYRDQIGPELSARAGADWAARVETALQLLRRGEAVAQMMKVAGAEGISDEDAQILHKAQFLDAVYLQQDAFDAVDAAMSFEAQVEAFRRIDALLQTRAQFADREAMRTFFARAAAIAKTINLSAPGSSEREAALQAFAACVEEAQGLSPPADNA